MTGDLIEELVGKESLNTYDIGFLKESDFGGWGMEEDTCKFIGRLCETLRPRQVLEFGTGLSTIILANEVSRGNIEKVWSVDHLKDFPRHHLSADGIVLLDNANRKNREQVYLQNWKRYFRENIDSILFLDEFKKGLACICPTGRNEPFSEFPLDSRLRDSWIGLKSWALRIWQILKEEGSECLL